MMITARSAMSEAAETNVGGEMVSAVPTHEILQLQK
jgi:hypothetical protein